MIDSPSGFSGWQIDHIPRLVTSWTVDERPAPWSYTVAIAAITAVGPLEPRTVLRGQQQINVYVFNVCFAGCDPGGVPFCQELTPPEDLEACKVRQGMFRDNLIKWVLVRGSAAP